MIKKPLVGALALALGLGLAGCDDDDSEGSANTDVLADVSVPETYNFESRFDAGAESALYPGQVTRQVLIEDLNTEISSGLQQRVDDGEINSGTSKQAVLDILNAFYVEGTAAIGDNQILLTTDPETLQSTYNEIATGKNLVDKTAGNDDVTDHKDWDNGDFAGWTADSPQALIQSWFDTIADNTLEVANGANRVDPINGEPIEIYHTEDGLDLKQLVQKFLLGAVTFSQGTDDYLDDDVDGKGLLTDNTGPDGTDPFSEMEHQWDEGFGYFGAARDYLAYTDDEIAGKGGRDGYAEGFHDTNDDGFIDLNGEFNFGNSTNAAKRDRGSVTGTDFTTEAMEAFLTGRALIAHADGELSEAQMDALKAQRDIAVEAWEKAVAATAVHYINETLSDMNKVDGNDTSAYSYLDHTKHWGELKGFALGLQFNPRSPMNEGTRFADFHELLTERPALPGDANFESYKDDLLAARDILQEAYGFAQEDVEAW